jgi:mono/diheme cytochrome c family protein
MKTLCLAAIASLNLAAFNIFAQAGGLTHRYSFNDGTANDSVGSANGALLGNATVQGGQLVLPNVTAATPATDYLQLPPGVVTNDLAVTVEAWATFSPNQYTWANLFDFGDQDGTGYSEFDIHVCIHSSNDSTIAGISDSDNANLDYQFIDLGPGSDLDGQTNLCLSIVFNPPAGYIDVFTNGALAGGISNVTIQMSGVQDVRNLVGTDNWFSNPGMQGSIDEFRIYNFALSAAQVQGDYQSGPDVLFPIATVTASPSNAVYPETPVTFDLATTGVGPFQYQWCTNSVSVVGATNSTFVLTNVTVSDAGHYEVVISDSAGSSTSAPITLTIIPPVAPSFTMEPTPSEATNYAGSLTDFSAVVAGTPPISLQWQYQGVNIPGATGTELILAALSTNDAGSYTLLASNSYGTNLSAVATLTVLTAPNNLEPNVLTSRYDNARDGANTNEYLLSPANVNVNTFGRLFSYAVDGYVYTQPLYVADLVIPGQGSHNVVFVATEQNTVYAFDADSNLGTNGGLLWQTNLGTAILSDNSEFGLRYGDPYSAVVPNIGITGTPVIDIASGTIYVNVTTREVGTATNYYHRIHALNITNGTEQPYSPVLVTASVPGAGVEGNGSVVTFDSQQQLQRAGLALAGGMLFVAYASYADTDPFHGWVLGFNAADLQPLTDYVFCSTPNATTNDFGANAGEGGIWMGGNGLCVDANTNIYFQTGNGSFSANTNGGDYGDSFVKLSTTNQVEVADYFTPSDQATLAANDTDLGSGGSLLLPDSVGSAAHPHLLVGCGKEGTIYLLDRDNMGQYNPTGDTQIVQELAGAVDGAWSSPAYFNNTIYYQTSGDVMRAFTITNGAIVGLASKSTTAFSAEGGTPTVSAFGTNNGIAWTLQSDAYASSGPAVLHAYNANNLAIELYNSSQNLARDNPGGAIKMTTPTVANGKVYIGAEYTLSVFGFTVFLATPVISPGGGPFTNAVTVTISDATSGAAIYYTLDGTVPTTNSILYTGPFVVTTTLNLQAVAAEPGTVNSGVASASFVNTAALGDGTGLLGEYWANTSGAAFTNIDFSVLPTLIRTDAVVSFNWSTIGPDPSIGQTNFAALWQGCVQPQYSESYTFTTLANDGVELWVNGQLLISDWMTNATTQSNSASITLNSQQLYNIQMDYFQSASNAVAQLLWSSPSTAQAVIPQTQLYPYTNPPPSVVLSGPTNGSTYTAAATVSFGAEADAPYNPLSYVSFYTNGDLLGTVSNAPYTFTVTGLAAGNYTVTATAADGSGLTSTSAPASFTVVAGSGLPYGLTNSGTLGPFLNQNMPGSYTGNLPALLSETGAYLNTSNRVPAPGLIPYVPNTPLWSDNAVKSRYMGVPNNLGLSSPAQQIGFAATGQWSFPAGTVFVKNFDLVVNQTNPSVPLQRLETRLLVRDTNGGVYGVTYKWLPDNSDAVLLSNSLTEAILVTNASGVFAQNWYYPSPADCLTCHTIVASNVLGVNTRQLNGTNNYPSAGITDNQLRTLNRLGLFYPAFNEANITNFEQLSSVTNQNASLVQRARSYLDANCSQCHQPGGTGITFDARYDTPLTNQNLVNYPAAFSLGYDNAKIISPNDVWRSVIYDRMNVLNPTIQMPPLARNIIDTNAVEVMAEWIDSLGGTPTLAPPILMPPSGIFTNFVTLTLESPDTNATLYYTLDGSLPTTNSTPYTGPINLASSTTVTANAFDTNFVNSVAVSGTFTIVPPLYSLFDAEFLANGALQMQYWAPVGQTYILQISTDLLNWTALSTNVPTSTPFT